MRQPEQVSYFVRQRVLQVVQVGVVVAPHKVFLVDDDVGVDQLPRISSPRCDRHRQGLWLKVPSVAAKCHGVLVDTARDKAHRGAGDAHRRDLNRGALSARPRVEARLDSAADGVFRQIPRALGGNGVLNRHLGPADLRTFDLLELERVGRTDTRHAGNGGNNEREGEARGEHDDP